MFLSLAFSFSAFSQNDSVPSQASDTSKTEKPPLMFCSSMPYFEECKSDTSNRARYQCSVFMIHQYISANFILSKEAEKEGKQGTIYARFTINKEGEVVDIIILKGISQELDTAAINAIRKIPKFNPARNLNKPVAIYQIIPIKVQLN